jgi:hypothetical protein
MAQILFLLSSEWLFVSGGSTCCIYTMSSKNHLRPKNEDLLKNDIIIKLCKVHLLCCLFIAKWENFQDSFNFSNGTARVIQKNSLSIHKFPVTEHSQ